MHDPSRFCYCWVSDSLDLKTSRRWQAGNVIPVLDPGNTWRRSRWKRVLDWYGVREVDEPVSFEECEGSTNHDGQDLILAIGDEVRWSAGILSLFLNREMDVLSSLDLLPSWLASRSARSVLVVAGSSDLTFRNVVLCSVVMAQKCAPLWGLMTAPDLPGLSFSVAKTIAARHSAGGTDGLLDVLDHRLEIDGTRESMTAESLGRWLERDWNAATIVAHGEGAHLFLEHAVLCGLPSSQERHSSGCLLVGCDTESCKRSRHGRSYKEVDLRARVLSLISCNSFSVAGEMYPSDSSLVLSATDGYPAYVITSPAGRSVEPSDGILLSDLLASGLPPAEAVAVANSLLASGGEPPAYVVVGDPVPVLPAPCRWLETASVANGYVDSKHRLVPIRLPDSAIEILEVRIGGSRITGGYRNEKSAIVVKMPSLTGKLYLAERCADVTRIDQWLISLGPKIRAAAALERNIRAIYGARFAANRSIQQSVAEIGEIRTLVDLYCSAARRMVELIRDRRIWDSLLNKQCDKVRELLSLWDDSFAVLTEAHLLDDGVVGDLIFPLLHFDHKRPRGAGIRVGDCRRCGNQLLRIEHPPGDNAVEGRFSVNCFLCGPLAEYGAGGPRLELRAPTAQLTPGVNSLQVTRHGADSGTPGYLVAEVRDKSRPGTIAQERRSETFLNNRTTVDFVVDSDAGSDQFSARAVWIQSMTVSLGRCVFEHVRAQGDVASQTPRASEAN